VEKTNIVLLGETEETSDLGGSLWSQSLWVGDIGQTGHLSLTLLDNNQGQDGKVHSDDATSDGLSLALSGASGPVARVVLCQQQPNTGWVHDTLLHWETLLVVSSGDLEDITLELVSDRVTWDFSSHTLVDEDTEAAVIVNFDELLGAIGWVSVMLR